MLDPTGRQLDYVATRELDPKGFLLGLLFDRHGRTWVGQVHFVNFRYTWKVREGYRTWLVNAKGEVITPEEYAAASRHSVYSAMLTPGTYYRIDAAEFPMTIERVTVSHDGPTTAPVTTFDRNTTVQQLPLADAPEAVRLLACSFVMKRDLADLTPHRVLT